MRAPTLQTVSVCFIFLQSVSALAEHSLQVSVGQVLHEVAQVEEDLTSSVALFVHGLETGEVITYAVDSRFPLNSTFKVFACAAQ